MWQKMLQVGSGSSGGSSKEHCAIGTTPTMSTTSWTEVECGFRPSWVALVGFASSVIGTSYMYDLSEDGTQATTYGVWRNSSSSSNVVNGVVDTSIILSTPNGFKYKANNSNSAIAYKFIAGRIDE